MESGSSSAPDVGRVRVLFMSTDATDAAGVMGLLQHAPGLDAEVLGSLVPVLHRLEAGGVDVILLSLDRAGLVGQDLPPGARPDRDEDVVRALAEAAPDVPLVVLTSALSDEPGIAAVRRGAHDYLLKNERDPDLLGRRLRCAVARQRARASLRPKVTQPRAALDGERLITAIEQAAETVVVTDAEGTMQYVNPAFETITGYLRQEAIGQNPRLLKSGQQDAAFYRAMWDTISSGRTWKGRIVNRKKDGTKYVEEATISPVHDESGDIVNYVAVKRDITRELNLEAQLLQAQKMESVGRLAGGVAHDFNNMLSVILGHTEMALEDVPRGGPLRADLEEIQRAAQRSANLTRQLLAFARRQTVAPTVLDLDHTVMGMLNMLRRLIGEHIELVWLPGAHPWLVRIDPAQVDQILANLVVNARDAIPGHGRVTIETGPAILDESFCEEHVGAVPGEYVQLTVSDDGAGIPPDLLEHIFEPFYTTKGVGAGTGLGLATVYGIVDQNQGYIRVASTPGEGTQFHIYLPRHRTAPSAPGVDTPPGEPAGGAETILLVEDEAAILKLNRRVLQRFGYTVLAAATPGEALRLAEDPAQAIDLLVTDVVMPEMTGRALADRISALRPALRCLFMSGYTADAIADHGVLEEGVHFLQKPFSIAQLAARVREVLDHR